MSPEFLLTAFIVCVTPGIGVVYTLSMTLGGGFRAGLWASVGCTIATVLHMVVALAGLAALLLASALLFQTVKYAGVAYLFVDGLGGAEGQGPDGHRPRRPGAGRAHRLARDPAQHPEPQAAAVLCGVPAAIPARAWGDHRADGRTGPWAFSAMTFLTFLIYAGDRSLGPSGNSGSDKVMSWMRRAFAAPFAALGPAARDGAGGLSGWHWPRSG